MIVEPDKIRRPMRRGKVSEKRCVSRKLHDIAVSLKSRHVRSFGKCRFHVVGLCSILTEKYRDTAAVLRGLHAVGIAAVICFIIVVAVFEEPLGRIVIMVVDKSRKVGDVVEVAVVKLLLCVLVSTHVHSLSAVAVVGACSEYQLDIAVHSGVFFFGFSERLCE